jgi:hypothetical protein
MASFPELYLTWDDVEYRCRINMDMLTQIEQRVALQALARDIVFDANNVKVSNVAWVIYCLLRAAGAPVTADDIWQGMKSDALSDEDVSSVMKFVITEIYGGGPENPAKKPPVRRKARRKAS